MSEYRAAGKSDQQFQADTYTWNNCVNASEVPEQACPAGQHFEGASSGGKILFGGCVSNSTPGGAVVSAPSSSMAAAAVATIPAPLNPAPAAAAPAPSTTSPAPSPNYVSPPHSTVQSGTGSVTPAQFPCPPGYYVDSGGICAPFDMGGPVQSSALPSSLSATVFGVPVWLIGAGAAAWLFLGSN